MADTAIAITAGIGTNVDTRTEGTNGNHRQVVTLGDPATNAGVAPVSVTAGLKVDLGGDNDVTVTSGAITETNSGTIAGDTTSIDGKITACNTGAVVVSSGTITETNSGTIAGDTTSIDGKITACNTGAVVVSSGAITETNSGTIAGDTTSIDGKITACNTGAVVVSSGAITETNSAGIETAVEIIDDWDATHDSAASADGVQLMGAYDSTKPTAVADGDAVRVLTDSYGRILTGAEPEAFQATITSADAQSATQVKAKTASKKMYILGVIISTDTAMSIQLQDDGSPTVLMEQIYLADNGGMAMTFPPQAPLVCGTNFDLDVIATAAGNISVTVTGYLAP